MSRIGRRGVWDVAILLFLGMAAPSFAQTTFGCQPSAGFLQYVENGKQDSNNWTVRGICGVKFGKNAVFGRGQLMRAQDASELTAKTLKAIEVFLAGDRLISDHFALGGLGGTFFDVDAKTSLRDPHQWTVGGYVKYRFSETGYVLVGVGHVAPVGGVGAFTVLEIPKGDHVAFTADAGVPLGQTRFLKNPFVVRSGVLLSK